MKMSMQSFHGDKIIFEFLRELRLFELSNLGSLLHYRVWSLCK